MPKQGVTKEDIQQMIEEADRRLEEPAKKVYGPPNLMPKLNPEQMADLMPEPKPEPKPSKQLTAEEYLDLPRSEQDKVPYEEKLKLAFGG